MKALDLTGSKFGRLTVLSKDEHHKGLSRWMCVCDCGGKKIAYTKLLRNGGCLSCGCLHTEHAMDLAKSNAKPIGYRRIKKQNGRPEIKTTRGFVAEHILVMEAHIGRRLTSSEVVHHKDENILNNSIDNLELTTNAKHTIHHHTGAKRSIKTRHAISLRATENAKNRKFGPKLSRDEAAEIRKSSLSLTVLAAKYKVSKSLISRIKNNRTWRQNGIAE